MLRFMVPLALIGQLVKKAHIIAQTSRGVSVVISLYTFVKKLSFTCVHFI